MNTRAFTVFVALLLLATLAAESNAFTGDIPGKRELGEKVRQHHVLLGLSYSLFGIFLSM